MRRREEREEEDLRSDTKRYRSKEEEEEARRRQDGCTGRPYVLGTGCMMPLVDPRRASSQSETECVVPRASLLPLPLTHHHRLPKLPPPQSSEVGRTEAARTRPADPKNHPKKTETQITSKDQQHQQHQHHQQPLVQQQLSQSEPGRPDQTAGKDTPHAHAHKGCVVRGVAGPRHEGKGGKGESWDPQRLEEESELALERRRQKLTQELMREMAGDSHHHMTSVDKKMHGQHQHSHRRNPSSSSSSSSSSTSSSSSSSTSSSSDSSPHRSGYKKESKRKSRPSKRLPSTSDRSKMKKIKSSSSLRKHSSSSSKAGKKSHPSKKDHDKLHSHSHGHSHKSSHSPTRRKTLSKKLLSPGRKRTPSPSPSSRKTHKLSPGRSKRSKSRKRSGSPRDRLEYRTDRLGLAERSLSHGREATLAVHSTSSSRTRDPRVDERVRRVSPEQLSRDRYSRYEKERIEEYVEPRRERRSPVAPSRPREVERKDSHRHRDYER
ncbi:serine/arginine repetitive matrix protein 2-like, partial [Eriocheir sinensis]|uniref:serine/arginine repetitive matrix protein 2-like n=1 Tax=Eriocheir sinensis TaxID=95602 RepID=UPI0021C8CDAA